MWPWPKILVFCVPFILVLLAVGGWFLFRETIRTRLRIQRALYKDEDIDEWLVIFDWSRKVLYLPTIIASLLACLLMYLRDSVHILPFINPATVGGIWLVVFFLNFVIDEFEVNFKLIVSTVLTITAVLLWLAYLDWLRGFFRFFAHLGFRMDALGYLLLAIIFAMAIVISWIRRLFYYVAITPNYMNIQVGLTETGEQVSREEYETRVDTGDFLERLLGFGRIIIIFDDRQREPMNMLVWGIGKKARALESVRGKLTVDHRETVPKNHGEPPEEKL